MCMCVCACMRAPPLVCMRTYLRESMTWESIYARVFVIVNSPCFPIHEDIIIFTRHKIFK